MSQIMNGTTYHDETPADVIKWLENARRTGQRIRVFYGHIKDEDGHKAGQDWHEEYDTMGTVSRSMGPTKIPLLISKRTSYGGGGILDHCIVRIMQCAGVDLYRHPQYDCGRFENRWAPGPHYGAAVYIDGVCHAQFKTEEQAARWILFMQGKRFSK